jgi:di/tricarboxylate transporter
VALGEGAHVASAIPLLLIVLLASNLAPAPIATLVCAGLMVIAGVLTLPQIYRGKDWNTCILIGAMIPPATAMTKTGAAAMLGDYVVSRPGRRWPAGRAGRDFSRHCGDHAIHLQCFGSWS